MKVDTRRMRATILGVALLAMGAWGLPGADLELGDDFGANESIETLTVKIDLGEGDDLSEAVALDLGLGFPLWLHPLGHEIGETAPFGATPQRADVEHTARAQSSAVFTFDPTADAGPDILKTCSQLLSGVRISDISRIGFLSRGDSNWVLDGYEIRINDKLFVAHEDLGASVTEALESARERIDAINVDVIPLETEGDDIAAFVEAGLATEEDEARLEEIRQQIAPLQQERHRFERVLDGSYPWFEDTDFEPPGRTGEPLGDVRVTVLTDLHEGASTNNYVYYRTGGHSFVIGSPAMPLQGDSGPQTFRLDLLAGTLTAADIRGHAVGLLGQEAPHDTVPDRWHPRRLIVEVDGRVVYDSEENELDRMSLESIRVIPPVHFDGAGVPVENTPNPRETYVWQAGNAMGLDLVHGGAAELPPQDDPHWPEPEPGLVFDEGEGSDGFDTGFDPFPGETYPEDAWVDDWDVDDDWYVDIDTGDPWDGDYWHFDPPPSWLDLLLGILDRLIPLPDGILPDPAGEPIQVHDVRITAGTWAEDTFTISWDLAGNESEIDHFAVVLLPARLDRPELIVGAPLAHAEVEAGAREHSFALSRQPIPENAPYVYLAPLVVAFPRDDSLETPHAQWGPGRPLIPHGSAAMLPFPEKFRGLPDGGGTVEGPIDASPPAHPDRAVWQVGHVQTNNGLLIDTPPPTPSYVVRPAADDVELQIYLQTSAQFTAASPPLMVVADVCSLGGPDVVHAVRCRMRYQYVDGSPYVVGDWQTLENLAVPGAPRVVTLQQELEPLAGGDVEAIRIRIEFGPVDGGSVLGDVLNAEYPPVVINPRVVPVP